MTDAYDLFIIGIITPMIAVVYFNGKIDPTGEGLVKGAAAWGTLCVIKKNYYILNFTRVYKGTIRIRFSR